MPLFKKPHDTTDDIEFWYWAPDSNPTDITSPAALYSFSAPNNPLISSLLHSPAASDVVHARSITFTLPGSPGVTVNVVEDNGNLDFNLATTSSADLSGLFFDFTSSKLSSLSVSDSLDITQFVTGTGAVGNLTNGVNLNGLGVSRFDVGMEFGTAGIGGDHKDIHSESFVLSDSAHDLSIDDLHPSGETGTLGVRTLSVGQKLEAVAPYAPTAQPDTVTTPEDVSITIGASNLATDLNKGAVLTIDKIGIGVEGPQYGTVSISPDGKSLTYTPTILDHLVDGVLTGNQDAFQVSVKDNFGGEVTSFVTVNATPVADKPTVNVSVLTPHSGDPINEVRLLITSHSGDHGTVNQGSDFLSNIMLNLSGDVTDGTTIIGDSGGLVAANTGIDSSHVINLSTHNLDTFSDEVDLLMPAGTSLNDNLAVTATAAETEATATTATGTYDQTIGIKFQHTDETPQFQTLANDSIWNTGSSFSASKDLFLGADLSLNASAGALGVDFSSTGTFKAGLTDTFNINGGTITAHLPFDVTVDTTYNTTTDTLLIHTSDALQSGASFTTTGPGGSFTLGALFDLNDTLSLGGSLIDTLGLGFSYPFDVQSSSASLIPGNTYGGGSITDSDTTHYKIPVGPDPLAPIGYIYAAWPLLSATSTTQAGDTITGNAASNNFIQFDLDLLRWAAAENPVVFGPIEGVLGPPLNDPNGFAILQAFANVGANLQQSFALQAQHLDGTFHFADGSTQSFVVGQDITIPNASKLAGPDGNVTFSLSLTPDATLEDKTSVGVNVGADLYLLNNLPSVVNDLINTPIHLTGSTGVFSIPIADNGPFQLAFDSHNYNFVV